MDIEHSKATRPVIRDVADIIVLASKMKSNVAVDCSRTVASSASVVKHCAQSGYS